MQITDDRFLKTSKSDLREILGIGETLKDRVSDLLIEQLRNGLVTNIIHPEKVMAEIYNLENDESRSRTKPADTYKRGLLKGFWKKHFFQFRFFPKNVENSFRLRDPKSKVFENMALPIIEKEKDLLKASHDIARKMGSELYREKSENGTLTGEWIVFQKHNGKNFYLTLAQHGEDEAVLHERIKSACKSLGLELNNSQIQNDP